MTRARFGFKVTTSITLIAATTAIMGTLASGCAQAQPVRLDGVTEEWNADEQVRSDREWVYLRITPEAPMTTLQASGTPTRVLLDTDRSASTGLRVTLGRRTIGAEYEISLSPTRADGTAGNGSSVVRYSSDGSGEGIGHVGAGFHFSPTFASTEYEMRLSRELLGLTGRVTVGIEHGEWIDVVEAELPGTAVAHRADGRVPSRPLGAVRVMSWNALWGSPIENPEPFGRIIRVLGPDVLLFQEWNETDDDAMNEWFATHAKVPDRRWQAVTNSDMGVAIVTQLPIVMRLDEAIGLPGERDVRFIGAILETGRGNVLVGSMHLKCCGSFQSTEDLRRIREAEAISAFITGVIDRVGVQSVIIGGDLNLVGSRPPLDTLAAGLDVDGGDLTIANPGILGDNAVFTWRDPESSFSPGRLDYVLVGEARAAIRQAFVFNTALLRASELEGAGLRVDDSSATDHLAVVVDVEIVR